LLAHDEALAGASPSPYGDVIEITGQLLSVLRAADPTLDFRPVTVVESLSDAARSGFGRVLAAIAGHGLGPITASGLQERQRQPQKPRLVHANLRPCVAYPPIHRNPSPGMDVVIVRENGRHVCHRAPAGDEVYQCLKLITTSQLRADRALRLQYARATAPPQGRLHDQDHHEDDRWPVHQGLRRDSAGYPEIR
jgi:isocitrate/isopropylmalate dehydrogenase